jgi:hypothetical protein
MLSIRALRKLIEKHNSFERKLYVPYKANQFITGVFYLNSKTVIIKQSRFI